jgi:uncharacterized protein (DUF488 family)
MFYRTKILLSLLQLIDNELEKIRLQKLLMLLANEQSNPGFHFVPYKFGCYSFQANADLKTMVKYDQIGDNDNMWVKIDPENYFPQLKETDRKALQWVKRRFGHYTTPELIHYTYKNFPYYALNSTIAAEVLTEEEVTVVENERPICTGAALFTIGYEGKTLEQYLNTLIRYGVEVLCDVRKNPVSMKYGFSKSQLQYACSGLGIKYIHMPDLGIESDKRQQLNNQADYDRLFLQYRHIVLTSTRTQQNEILKLLKSYKRVALTCFEANICQCHRTHLAEELSNSPEFKYDLQHI